MKEPALVGEPTRTVLGIDLGTSNCACAIWDSTRGHPKWIRLGNHLATTATTTTTTTTATTTTTGKWGRIVPSEILLVHESVTNTLKKNHEKQKQQEPYDVSSILGTKEIVAYVGAAAVELLDQAYTNNNTTTSPFSAREISAAMITSAKRLLVSFDNNKNTNTQQQQPKPIDPEFVASLPVRVSESSSGELFIETIPLGSFQTFRITPVQAMAILLRCIHLEAEHYLRFNMRQKRLQVPGNTWKVGAGCVIGVPAQFDQTQRLKVLESARLAGLDAATTLTESTAAAMAYGLFVAGSKVFKTILVLDMGGGTTDITIAETTGEDTGFRVQVALGNPRLGGDDMDQAILMAMLQKTPKGDTQPFANDHLRRDLLRSCKRAKEQLCGDVDHGYTQPAESVSIQYDGTTYNIGQSEFEESLKPCLQKLDRLVEEALDRLASIRHSKPNDLQMDEVILVGGATRVPAIRTFLRNRFPPPHPIELCFSVNAMAAVAQGAAVKAAINSKLVPLHELRSAMMLDTVPHDIGVLLEHSNEFVRLIARDSTLPASGSAIFQLANLRQKGVTLEAVEKVADDTYVRLGVFSFILHRLTEEQFAQCQDGTRSVEIIMTLQESGGFIVSIYDDNDPEQKRRRKRSKQTATNTPNTLSYVESEEEGIPPKQQVLMLACLVLFALYLYLKMVFQDHRNMLTEDL